jgi:hypothetical protein
LTVLETADKLYKIIYIQRKGCYAIRVDVLDIRGEGKGLV